MLEVPILGAAARASDPFTTDGHGWIRAPAARGATYTPIRGGTQHGPPAELHSANLGAGGLRAFPNAPGGAMTSTEKLKERDSWTSTPAYPNSD